MKLQWYCRNIFALSGYSDEARGMIRALEHCGVEVSVVGKNKYPWMGGFTFQGSIDREIPIVYHTFRHSDYDLIPGQYSIVRTMLEVDRIPPNWVSKLNRADEVWVPSAFNRQTFINSGVDPSRIFVIHGPLDLSVPTPEVPFRLPTQKKFVFLSLFDFGSSDRKGLDILLKAYVASFGPEDDVALAIKAKTSIQEIKKIYSLPEPVPEICVINRVLDPAEYQSLFEACDCFVLPTRGEGICRPIMTAMNCRVPVITTGWSGQMEYINRRNACLIDYRLSDVPLEGYLKNPGFFGSRWAEPSVDHLKMLMKDAVIKGRFDSMTDRAEKDMQSFLPIPVGEQLITRLQKPLPKNTAGECSSLLGERLFPVHLSCPDGHHFPDDVSVGILGGGIALKRAVHFFKDHNIQYHCLDASDLSNQTHESVDILVISDFLKNIPSHYRNIEKRVSSMPIYVFDF